MLFPTNILIEVSNIMFSNIHSLTKMDTLEHNASVKCFLTTIKHGEFQKNEAGGSPRTFPHATSDSPKKPQRQPT